MMRKLIIIFILFLTLFFPVMMFGENIRGDVVKNIILSDNSKQEDNVFLMSIEDVFAISFDKNSNFIKGFEIEVKVPTILRNYGNSFAFNIYKQISPEIDTGIGTYYGQKYHSLILPEAAKFYIQAPYKESLQSENMPYTTVLSTTLDYNDSPLMVTVLPMMKGFPSSLYSNNFTISVYPLLKESGTIDLSLQIPEELNEAELTLKIDGNIINTDKTDIQMTLSAGSHSLNAEISGGRSINRNFIIRTGETTNLNIEIESLESFVTIDVPENTDVYIDGIKLDNLSDEQLSIIPGEHLVMFRIGDYKISKKFDILPGKDCKISLFLDIFVEEN